MMRSKTDTQMHGAEPLLLAIARGELHLGVFGEVSFDVARIASVCTSIQP